MGYLFKKNSWDFYVCAVNKSGKKYPCTHPVVFKPCFDRITKVTIKYLFVNLGKKCSLLTVSICLCQTPVLLL